MVAGRIILTAIGPQDFHLTANPQITFFKSVFRRHTNFSKVVQKLFFKGGKTPQMGIDNNVIRVPHEADLLGNVFFKINIKGVSSDNKHRSVANFSNSLIKKVSFKIGGSTIDTHYGRFYQILDELEGRLHEDQQVLADPSNGGKYVDIDNTNDSQQSMEKINSYSRMTGNYSLCFGGSHKGQTVSNGTYTKSILYPLKFWFNKNPGQYLPLLALKKHILEIFLDLTPADDLKGNLTSVTIDNLETFAEYYILDDNEKTRFAQSNHEYIIEQLQENVNGNGIKLDSNNLNSDIELYFNNPVKYLTWVVVNKGTNGSNNGMGDNYYMSLTNSSVYGNDGDTSTVDLKLNNKIINYEELPMIYYTRFVPYNLCKSVPVLDRIGMYSFAINPLDSEPSGTCNFSKLKDNYLKLVFDSTLTGNLSGKQLFIYAVNYNVLTITGGMGGLRYE